MTKLLLLSLWVATASAFSISPKLTANTQKKSTTAVFYFGEETRFDVIGDQRKSVLAERENGYILQGGSDVGWSMNGGGPGECDAEDPNCYYIEPYHDVVGLVQATNINAEQGGGYKLQGGSQVDWHEDGFAGPIGGGM